MTQYIYNDLTTKLAAVEVPEGAINLSKILEVLQTAEDIDWASIVKIIENKENDLAVISTIDDLLKLISPFVPQAAIAASVLGFIIFLLKNTHPSQPYDVPGYHWDMLYGWVPNEEETK